MNQSSYPYDRRYATRYTFVSKGKRGAILKAVQFTPTSTKNILNLSFGDLRPDGSIDDMTNSNNNDIKKVIATVIETINDFTTENPAIKIVFTGSNAVRTSFYFRILKPIGLNLARPTLLRLSKKTETCWKKYCLILKKVKNI